MKKSYLHLSIGAVSLLLIDLLLAMPAEAHRFTCRASAVRVVGPIGIVDEPVVANPPDDPCLSDHNTAAGFTLASIVAGVLDAATVGAPATEGAAGEDGPVTAEGQAANFNISGLVGARVLHASARVDSMGGKCIVSSGSNVISGFADGQTFTGTSHLDVVVTGLGTVHFNETLGGRHPTSGKADFSKVTQRALWIQITDATLKGLIGTDVIVGEAIADFSAGNPCK